MADVERNNRLGAMSWGGIVREGSAVRWLHSAHSGGIVLATNESGGVVGQVQHGVWGEVGIGLYGYYALRLVRFISLASPAPWLGNPSGTEVACECTQHPCATLI